MNPEAYHRPPKVIPPLDPAFQPAVLWNRTYQEHASRATGAQPLALAIARPSGECFVRRTQLLPPTPEHADANLRYVERLLKSLLWYQGGATVWVGGAPQLADQLAHIYSPTGSRAFDAEMIGERIFGTPLSIRACPLDALPPSHAPAVALGRHLEGCRIGFDLGGSDRKCAALIDGKVVFSEEVPWAPYFEGNPQYHIDGIRDSLQRAAAHLPRVDAIGGSAAGVYVNSEVRVASLFRGVSETDFERQVRRIFRNLQCEWNNVPFEVVNDGEVTALAGSMSLGANEVLGISMGTSEAAGYCDAEGHITPWLNELAFAPVDYRADAPVDEWSGDRGCGAQFFSQQGVARLAPAAGMVFPDHVPLAERLVAVQEEMARGSERAASIYDTIGVCFGYAIAQYADFYPIQHLLILGRVTSGPGVSASSQKPGGFWKSSFQNWPAALD